MIDPLETWDHIAGLMNELHPTLWSKAYWEIGREIRRAIVATHDLTGQHPYNPSAQTLCGWHIKWTDGSELQLRAESSGHLWVIR